MSFWGGIANIRQTPAAGAGESADRVQVLGVLWVNLDDPDNPHWERWNGAAWVDFNASAPTLPAWALAGNALAGGEKFGSTNDQPVVMYHNNIEVVRLLAAAINIAQDVVMPGGKKITIGNTLQLFDDTAGPRILQALGGQRMRVRANGTSGSYIDLSAVTDTRLLSVQDINIGTRNNLSSGVNVDSDTATRRVVVQIGFTDLSVNVKAAVLKSRDMSTGIAGVKAPDLYLYAGINTTDLVRQNVYIAHDGTNPVGLVGIGNNSATSRADITGDTGYTQLRLRTSYTPTGTGDVNGATGDTAWDDNFFYLKTSAGWKRAALTIF